MALPLAGECMPIFDIIFSLWPQPNPAIPRLVRNYLFAVFDRALANERQPLFLI
jgi:hypothetical protein